MKDEELQNLSRDIRARDSTIKELAEKLSETAEAAESAASAAYTMDEQRRIACAEVERLTKDSEKQFESSKQKVIVDSHQLEEIPPWFGFVTFFHVCFNRLGSWKRKFWTWAKKKISL